MSKAKPLIQVASCCENIIEEKDGVFTAVRLIDTYFVPPVPPGLPEGAVPIIVVKALISLKSGDVVGPATVAVQMTNTKGEKSMLSPEGGFPVVFDGGEQGTTIRVEVPVGVTNFGLCWFDVLVDGEMLTRIPLRLRPLAEMPKNEPKNVP